MLVKLPYLCQKGFIDIYFCSQDKANQARQGSNAHRTSDYVLYRPPFIRAGKIAGNFSNFAIRGQKIRQCSLYST